MTTGNIIAFPLNNHAASRLKSRNPLLPRISSVQALKGPLSAPSKGCSTLLSFAAINGNPATLVFAGLLSKTDKEGAIFISRIRNRVIRAQRSTCSSQVSANLADA
ncbi:hypothetical protein SAMN04487894_101360 [Niabella drilacis]|uniref:Uncharacterized protein n=1 Tax=Niabella drilacis (strain DSM 25811 / CCM 8410 / CCUG 62505 / LMG 26954 / E90) TaxID=1285928 RepID=A0A1G6IY18_NIADE|nr:hypothetical protein SAMN04487894_101360 [Niabella drilacis]